MKDRNTNAQRYRERPARNLRRVVLYLFVGLVFIFLVLPSLAVIPLSVSDSPYLQFPPKGFTWRWYQDYFGVEGVSLYGATGRWVPATLISLELALLVVVGAVPVGALAAYGLARGNYRGKFILNAIIISPLIMPVLVTAIALFFYFSKALRWFFGPLPTPDLPVWGEWIILAIALFLNIAAIGVLLAGPVLRKRGESVLINIFDRMRPWAPLTLGITSLFFLVTWAAGASNKLHGGLFSLNDPIPPVPLVSPGLVVAHIVLAIPYVVIILTATLRGVDVTLDRAAAILGAGPFTVFRRVILPCMTPGLTASAFFCFIVSWDELLIALFLSTAEVSTLPKEIWDGIRTEISPTIAAISTMLLLLTIFLLAVGYIFQTRMKTREDV